MFELGGTSKRIFFVTLAAACLVTLPSLADGVDQAVDALHQTCLAHGPDFERTVAQAATRRWTPLSGYAALAPVNEVSAFRAWEADEELPSGTMIAVTRGNMDGRAVQTCTVKLPNVDRAQFEERFFERTDAEKIGETRTGSQVSKLYILVAGNRKQLVHLTSMAVSGRSDIIIVSSIVDD
ncbi:MAG: hypothetical protein E5W04_22300 [Mesorhizobium sp.]|nr:MAG: hypothetical protein E5W04_22300 [Mesorhizobium sp.]